MQRLPKLSEDAPRLVNTLVSLQTLLTIKGELTDARVGEAYVALPPSNRSFVDLVLAS